MGDKEKRTQNNTLLRNIIGSIAVVIVFILGVFFIYTNLPVNVDWSRNGPPSVGVDWKAVFRPATLELLQGRSPYKSTSLLYPVWVLIPLIPIAILPPALGSAVIYVVNLVSYIFVMLKLKFNILLIIIVILFSGLLVNSENGNIEGILAIGFVLPPPIGLFFLLPKPQIGLAVTIFWFVNTWREEGVKKTIITFLPVSIAYLILILLFGPWFLDSPDMTDVWWNASIWPTGIPIGILLTILAIWKKEIKFAIAASPFFAPYLTFHSWSFVLLGLAGLVPNFSNLKKKTN